MTRWSSYFCHRCERRHYRPGKLAEAHTKYGTDWHWRDERSDANATFKAGE